MIKITVMNGREEESTLFSEAIVIIGDPKDEREKEAGSETLSLPGIGLKPQHVKITIDGDKVTVQNLANDPFVTLNNLPFYKKEAPQGAILRIRERDLKLERAKEFTSEPAQPKAQEPLPPPLKKPEPQKDRQPEDEILQEEIIRAPKKKLESPPPISDADTYKDDDPLIEEESKNWMAHLNVSPFRHVKLYSLFLMVFFLVLSVVGVEAYLRAGEKSDEDEVKAAESLADIAMALTYAQVYHFAPQKHNWSDPVFIQNNLLATLPTGSSSGTILNCQGDFSGCAYFLRVYTSNDLSRFLIVAHPNPTFLQWLIPKSALVVDSDSMEIRRIRNVKAMNRLLTNLNTLDGINLSQITDLIKNEEVITLSYLAKMAQKPEFQPPRVLAFMRPGAENLIYNAPRYHPFGDALLKKAGNFAQGPLSSHELQMLQSELEILKKFPNLVLYTTHSIEEGKSAVNALKKIGPNERYLLASIKYDPKGRFLSSKIEMDHERKVKPNLFIKESPFVAKAEIFELPNPKVSQEIAYLEAPQKESSLLDTQLKSIADTRVQNIQRLKQKAYQATDDYLDRPRAKRLIGILKKTRQEIQEEEEKAKEAVYEVSLEWEGDFEQFRAALESHGLKGLLDAS